MAHLFSYFSYSRMNLQAVLNWAIVFWNSCALAKSCSVSVGLCAIETANRPIRSAWLSTCTDKEWSGGRHHLFWADNGEARSRIWLLSSRTLITSFLWAEERHSKVTVPEIHLKAPCINIFWRILPHCQVHWNMGYRAPHYSWPSNLWDTGA